MVQTINTNEIKLNCITLDFCNDLAEDSSDEEENVANKGAKETGESENQLKNKQFLL